MTISCCGGSRWWPCRRSRPIWGAGSTSSWSTSTRTPTPSRLRSCSGSSPTGAGVTVVGDDAQAIYAFRAATVRNILDFPHRFAPPARDRDARAELPLDPADPGRRQRRDRAGARGLPQAAVLDPALGAAAAAGHGPRRPRPGRARRGRRSWPTARPGWPCATRPCCSAPPATAPPSSWSWPAATSPTSSSAACASSRRRMSRTCWPMLRWAENPRDQVAAFRVLQLLPGHRPGDRTRALDAIAGKLAASGGRAGRRPAAAEHWPRLAGADGEPGDGTLAGAARPGARASTTRCSTSSTTSPPAGAPISTSSSGWPRPCRAASAS